MRYAGDGERCVTGPVLLQLGVSDFDARALEYLRGKTADQAGNYLDRYRSATSADHVRNPCAYCLRLPTAPEPFFDFGALLVCA